jgi:hypothetical protein
MLAGGGVRVDTGKGGGVGDSSFQFNGSVHLKIFIVGINATIIAPGGFAGNAEFGQVY